MPKYSATPDVFLDASKVISCNTGTNMDLDAAAAACTLDDVCLGFTAAMAATDTAGKVTICFLSDPTPDMAIMTSDTVCLYALVA